MDSDTGRRLHRRARIAVAGAFALILAGGLVTSRDAGLSVPDWPLAFGQINPPGWWRIENIRTEHGHRILAFFVASWTAFLLVSVLRGDRRVLVRRLTIAAAGLVLLQALLGGLRVLELSVDLAMIHGVVGQVFFATLAAVATVTSPSWDAAPPAADSAREQRRSAVLLAAISAQLLLGLFIRHLGASLRPLDDKPLFYAHVVGAGVVLCALLDLQRDSGKRRDIPGSTVLLPVVCLQLVLGIAAYVATNDMTFDRETTMFEAWIPTIHVGVGAVLLALAVVRNLYAWRHRLANLDNASALEPAR